MPAGAARKKINVWRETSPTPCRPPPLVVSVLDVSRETIGRVARLPV
ncbi:MAG: hypothetical protein MPL62_04685 [Alphaproteobacteria bacterium]|nr:hypothetical protein [Alphaproteobacteria bacterium]